MKYVLIGLTFAACVYAQNAQVAGFVKDQSSSNVPNARVLIKNVDTGVERSSLTAEDGLYSIPALLPGKYTMTVQHEGFDTVVREGIILQVAQNARIDFTLHVGAAQQAVTVMADAPLVNSTDASVSTVVDRQFVEEIPLNGRSFQSLIALAPGVVITPTTQNADQGQFSVSGQRAGSNYFAIDGVSANFAASNGIFQGQTANGGLPAFSAVGSTASLVSIDALQEFRLETSTYAPEFGRQSGAQAILLTRSGTNSFHGTAFEYFRNDALDANDWFANSAGQPKPRERQNDFGGVLSGPINKDKTFFFFSYEGLRVAQPFVAIGDVPSLAARANAAPNVKALVDSFPLPNGPSTGIDQTQLTAAVSNNATLDAASLRIDRSINSKVTSFGRFNHAPSDLVLRASFNGANGFGPVRQKIDTGTFGSTMLFTPRVTNDVRFNYSRAHGSDHCELDGYGGAVVPPDNGLATPYTNLATGWAYFGIYGGRNANQCEGLLADVLNHQVNVTDTVAYTKGSHSFKFGFDFRQLTPQPTIPTNNAWYFWNTMQDFVNGEVPVTSDFLQSPNSIHLRFHNYSAFAQDTWKLSGRLTLTYGIRWDYNPPPVETSGHAPYVISEISNLATATLLPPGTPLWHADWKNFAPRLGVAYQLHQSSERPTILRVGVGQFYDLGTSTSGDLNNGEGGWYPYNLITTICNQGTGPYCNATVPYNGPPPAFVFTPPYTDMRAFDPHLKLPYSLEWSVAVEQALSRAQSFKVTYIGSAGRRLLRDDLINNPNPILAGLELTKNSGYSNYEGLQLQFQRRLSHGLQALVSYTWSHSLDTNSADVTNQYTGGGAGIPTTLVNVRQDYGSSDFDIRHSFSAAVTYSIPPANVQNTVVRTALRNWSIDGISSARTGTPFSVTYTPETAGAFAGPGGAFALRPDQVSGVPVYISDGNAPGGKILNPAAFTVPQVLRQGSEGRNTIRGFPMVQIDLALRRQFRINEHLNLQFRVEGFNVINHPNFAAPLSNIGTCAVGAPCTQVYGWGYAQGMLNQNLGANSGSYGTGFGSLYQVGGPRSLQLSMRLQF